MKNFILIFCSVIIFSSCHKEDNFVTIKYIVSDATSNMHISYQNEEGILQSETYHFESMEDIWSYEFENKIGEIVYVSALYEDSIASVKVQISIDGKGYKENASNNDPGKYVIVSGTIPY